MDFVICEASKYKKYAVTDKITTLVLTKNDTAYAIYTKNKCSTRKTNKVENNNLIMNLDNVYRYSIINKREFDFTDLNLKYGIKNERDFRTRFQPYYDIITDTFYLYVVRGLAFDDPVFEFYYYSWFLSCVPIPLLKGILIYDLNKFINIHVDHFAASKTWILDYGLDVCKAKLKDIYFYYVSIYLKSDFQDVYRDTYQRMKSYKRVFDKFSEYIT